MPAVGGVPGSRDALPAPRRRARRDVHGLPAVTAQLRLLQVHRHLHRGQAQREWMLSHLRIDQSISENRSLVSAHCLINFMSNFIIFRAFY